MEVDPISLEVFRQALVGIAEEMGMKMKRAAFSSIIKERDDRSCAFFTPDLEMVAQADHLPSHLGILLFSAKNAIKEIGVENLRPGDITIHNDPYIGGSHLPDVITIAPIFYSGELVALNAVMAHWTDIGGSSPGSLGGDAREILAEGLRIPPIKIVSEGRLCEDLVKLIGTNVRVKDDIMGDLRAQIAANKIGEQRFINLLKRYSVPTAHAYMDEIIEYSYRRTVQELKKLPEGTYSFEDWLEDDGTTGQPVRIVATVRVKAGQIEVDFTGSSEQRPGPVNAVFSVTSSAVFFTLKCFLDPTIPTNAGVFRPVKIIAPKGTVVNAAPPAAVAGGSLETSQRMVDALLGAFSKIVPGKVTAAGAGTFNCVSFGGFDPFRRKPFVILEQTCGGGGARPTKDGLKAVRYNISNTPNNPIEVIESEFPLLVESYELRPDSGGAGKRMGGLGTRKAYRLLADADISILAERAKLAPWGLFGGKCGATGHYEIITKEGPSTVLPSKSSYRAKADDLFLDCTPGGGGYGPAAQRDRQLIEDDLKQGYVSEEFASKEFGLTRQGV